MTFTKYRWKKARIGIIGGIGASDAPIMPVQPVKCRAFIGFAYLAIVAAAAAIVFFVLLLGLVLGSVTAYAVYRPCDREFRKIEAASDGDQTAPTTGP